MPLAHISILLDLGDSTLGEVVHLILKYTMSTELAMQRNVYGRFGKVAFGRKQLFQIVCREYHFIAISLIALHILLLHYHRRRCSYLQSIEGRRLFGLF